MRTAEEPPASFDHLRQALIESRQRWRDFGTMAAEIAFEMDRDGRLSFLAPQEVLGWASEELLGRHATDVFVSSSPSAPDPFLGAPELKRHRVWVRQSDGREICLALSSVSIRDESGARIGTRGVAADVTAQE